MEWDFGILNSSDDQIISVVSPLPPPQSWQLAAGYDGYEPPSAGRLQLALPAVAEPAWAAAAAISWTAVLDSVALQVVPVLVCWFYCVQRNWNGSGREWKVCINLKRLYHAKVVLSECCRRANWARIDQRGVPVPGALHFTRLKENVTEKWFPWSVGMSYGVVQIFHDTPGIRGVDWSESGGNLQRTLWRSWYALSK